MLKMDAWESGNLELALSLSVTAACRVAWGTCALDGRKANHLKFYSSSLRESASTEVPSYLVLEIIIA